MWPAIAFFVGFWFGGSESGQKMLADIKAKFKKPTGGTA